MGAAARGVGADRERGEGERGRLARGGDERAVDRDLELVVVRVEVCGLVQEEQVLSRRVPPDWSRGRRERASASARTRGRREGQPTRAGERRNAAEGYSRWSGTESIHLFSAESSSATICCSHCCPTNPRSALDLLIEYCRPKPSVASYLERLEGGTHDCAHGKGEDLV